jgi:hypothetical protein
VIVLLSEGPVPQPEKFKRKIKEAKRQKILKQEFFFINPPVEFPAARTSFYFSRGLKTGTEKLRLSLKAGGDYYKFNTILS